MTHLSLSPNTGRSYRLPNSDYDDKLDQFLATCDNSNPMVVVQGLGFVGLAMSLVVANSDKCDYNVIGVDQCKPDTYWKIPEIREGICPVKSSDKLFNLYFETALEQGNFFPTYDTRAYQHADVIIVDINLDVDKVLDKAGSLKSSSVSLCGFKSAIKSIGENCKENVIIIVETTVPPGTCSKIVKPIIEENLRNRGMSTDKYTIGHSYERVMPGPNYINSIKNFYRVYSGVDTRSAIKTEEFLKTVISTDNYPLTELQNTESTEMAKVLENSYRAMNISFMVEWSRFAEAAGVNLYDVVNAIRLRPTHSNMMLPGIGVGGYCLTKDPIMASWASQEFFEVNEGLRFSVSAVEVNDKMPEFAYKFVIDCIRKSKTQVKHVSLLGVSYAPGIGDTRFSPVEIFARKLIQNDFAIEYHDPYVTHWEEMFVDVENDMLKLTKVDPDLIIISTGHREYLDADLIYEHLNSLKRPPLLIDTVGLLSEEKLSKSYTLGKNYYVLGVGV